MTKNAGLVLLLVKSLGYLLQFHETFSGWHCQIFSVIGPAVQPHGAVWIQHWKFLANRFVRKSRTCCEILGWDWNCVFQETLRLVAWLKQSPGSAYWTRREFEGNMCLFFELCLGRPGNWLWDFWLGLVRVPVCQFPVVLPSNWALSLPYGVQVILRLLQLPDGCYQPEGSCAALRKVDGFDPGRALHLWRRGFCLQSRDGKVLCRALGQCYPPFVRVEGDLSHKPHHGTQRNHFNFSLCWKHHMEKKMWLVWKEMFTFLGAETSQIISITWQTAV